MKKILLTIALLFTASNALGFWPFSKWKKKEEVKVEAVNVENPVCEVK